MITHREYLVLLNGITETHNLEKVCLDKDGLWEFLDQNYPIFTLGWLPKEEGAKKGDVGISFHVECDAASAIKWYFEVRHVCPEVKLAPCYFINSESESFSGDEAFLAKNSDLENLIIEQYEYSKKKSEGQTGQKVFNDLDTALKAFRFDKKKKGETEH